jgi:hypothetical protein
MEMKLENANPAVLTPACLLVHNMINKLSVIIGNCDLVIEATPEDSPQAQRLAAIRKAAESLILEVRDYKCDLIEPAKNITVPSANVNEC